MTAGPLDTPAPAAALSDYRKRFVARLDAIETTQGLVASLCTAWDEIESLRAALSEARAERDTLVDAVRLVGRSAWDAPGWNLHVKEEYARLLFDVAYGNVAEPRPLDGKESRAIRARMIVASVPSEPTT